MAWGVDSPGYVKPCISWDLDLRCPQ